MPKSLFRGVCASTVTPFAVDGSLKLDRLPAHVEWIIGEGAHALSPLGSSGEFSALETDDRKRVLEAVLAANNGRLPVVAGTHHYSTQITIELSQHAERAGADALLIVPPYYMAPTPSQVLDHFRRVAEAVSIPIVVYHNIPLTAVDLKAEHLLTLFVEGAIAGVKMSNPEPDRICELLQATDGNLFIYAGIDTVAFEGLCHGAHGWISGIPSTVPGAARKLYEAIAERGDLESARTIWKQLAPLMRLQFSAYHSKGEGAHWFSVMKAALNMIGPPVGDPCPPVLPLPAQYRRPLIDSLKQLGYTVEEDSDMPAEMMHVPAAKLRAFCREALIHTGLSLRDAANVAEALVTADSMGVFTHGTKLLIGYIRRLQGGGYRPAPQIRTIREGPAWAVIDGDNGLGQVGGVYAIQTAINKARQMGIAYVGLRNTGHIGAAGYYAWSAAQQGLIGIVFGNDTPSVAAPGSRGPVLGSNPIAFAIPIPGSDPILLDIATSAVAGGKVYAAHQRGEPIPSTWLIDRQGLPTTDGSLYPHQAALAPMAGHKGYGFALLAEVLAGVLTGGAITSQIGSWMFDDPALPSKHNAAFIALDVSTIAPPEEYGARMQSLAAELRTAPPAEGVECVLLPGDLEHQRRKCARGEGIPLPPDVIEKLLLVAEHTGVSWPPVGEAQ